MHVMISLIGEQPIPNLLPVLHQRPEAVLLVYTQRTQQQMTRLSDFLQSRGRRVECVEVPPYDILAAMGAIEQRLAEQRWRDSQPIFNLTGGTKTMAFAAYELAMRLKCDFFYLQTEGGKSLIYRYHWTAQGAPELAGQPEVIPALLTIDDYLRVHLGNYTATGFAHGSGGEFEQAAYNALHGVVDEIAVGVKHAGVIDLDLVVRCGNLVGIAEIKSGKLDMKPIGQLTTAASREHLGTYTRRFLISAQDWPNDDLRELAQARDVAHIVLPTWQASKALDAHDTARLQETVCAALGRRRAAP